MNSLARALGTAFTMFGVASAAGAECPVGSSLHTVDGVKKCVLDSNIVVVVDPDWLVAGGVALLLVLIAVVYLVIKVGRLAAPTGSTSSTR